MKVVLVNWSRVWEGASRGGGVNGYAQGLAEEMVKLGHEVSWLCGGWVYAPANIFGGPGPCTVRRLEDWRGIRVFEIINSPVVAPGIFQFNDPLGEISAPELEAEVTRFFHLLEPDVVHFHNIEGFSAGCVDAARTPSATWPGAKVLFSLHNYHTVCPQVYLMQGGRRACFDFENGHACVGCVRVEKEPAEERRARAADYGKPYEGDPDKPQATPAGAETDKGGVLGSLGLTWGKTKRLVEIPWPGKPVAGKADVEPAAAASEPVVALRQVARDAAEWRPLPNDPAPDPRNSRPMNNYGRRRRAYVEMLSRCDRVLAASRFVERKFAALGVKPEVLRTCHIGTRMTEIAAANPELLFEPPVFEPERPRLIRAVFMGYHNYFKGLPMLCDSLEQIEPSHLSRFHLFVYAKDAEKEERRLRRLEPRLGALTIRGEYEPARVPELLGGKDLGLVPSVWWDNGPQTVLEFFACGLPVLAAELGGIPDWVKDGVNGLLFRGNDREHLASRLIEVADAPSGLFALRRNVRPPVSMPDHAAAMEAAYRECLADRA